MTAAPAPAATRPPSAPRAAESDVPEPVSAPAKPRRVLCVVRDLDGRYVENAWLIQTPKGERDAD
jgi:hypothetical protein